MPHERIQHGKIFVVSPRPEDSPNPPSIDDTEAREWTPGEVISENQVLREEPSLDVFWNRDGEYVQVAIEAPSYWWKKFMEGRVDDPQILSFSAFTNVLTRKEINHMIRILRRARDAAYGSDE